MADEMTRGEFGEILEKLTARAASDPEFRSRALTNPRQALAEIAGRELPEFIRVRFVNHDESVLRLPPPASGPDRPSDYDDELTPDNIAASVGSNCGMAVGRCSF